MTLKLLDGDIMQMIPKQLLGFGTIQVLRSPGAAVAFQNYGAWNGFSEVVVPASNVGTLLQLINKIADYSYLEVEIRGTAAEVRMIAGGQTVLDCITGITGAQKGTYVMKLPKVEGLEALEFRQAGIFAITRITAFCPYNAPKFTQERNLDVIDCFPRYGAADDGTTFSILVPAGDTATVYPYANLPMEATAVEPSQLVDGPVSGSLKVKVVPSTIAPVVSFVWNTWDGFTYQCSNWQELEFNLTDDDRNSSLVFLNVYGQPFHLLVTPLTGTVGTVATTYGANTDPTVADLDVLYCFLDTYDGVGTLADHDPNVGGPYVAFSGALTDCGLTGSGAVNWGNTAGAAVRAISTITPMSVQRCTLTLKFTPTTVGAASSQAVLSVRNAAGGVEFLYLGVQWDGGTFFNHWSVVASINSNTGVPLYLIQPVVDAIVVLGAENTLIMDINDSGTTVTLNGTVLGTTTIVPDAISVAGRVAQTWFSQSGLSAGKTLESSVVINPAA